MVAEIKKTMGTDDGRSQAENDDRDEETGLPDAVGFLRCLDRLPDRRCESTAVVTFHVDTYDQILRFHGERIAGMLLAQVAGLFARELRPGDCLGHFGCGDFALMFPGENVQELNATLARFELTLMRHPFKLPAGGGSEEVRMTTVDCHILGDMHRHKNTQPSAMCGSGGTS